MHIDSYKFGKVVIDGSEYDNDLIIVAGSVRSNWWRKSGHSLSIEDLQTVIAAKPAVLIVGCGAYGVLKIPEQTRQSLLEQNIRLEAFNTHEAVERFNELNQSETALAAALHLTC